MIDFINRNLCFPQLKPNNNQLLEVGEGISSYGTKRSLLVIAGILTAIGSAILVAGIISSIVASSFIMTAIVIPASALIAISLFIGSFGLVTYYIIDKVSNSSQINQNPSQNVILPNTTDQIHTFCLGQALIDDGDLLQQFIRDNNSCPEVLLKKNDEYSILPLNLDGINIAGDQFHYNSAVDARVKSLMLSDVHKKLMIKNLLPAEIRHILGEDSKIIRKAVVLMTQGAENDTYVFLSNQEGNEEHIISSCPTNYFNKRVIFEVQNNNEVLLKINRTYVLKNLLTEISIKKFQTTTIFNLTNLEEKPKILIS